ncbi:hypothetical protein GCM10023074_56670 [Microbispora amethystogenes]|uniref:Secreted protein n=1 Tax=Microbispora amethystogenes TaxID=1427754 RepID=A0ABQ4FI10_9ACTN|nr:hypothetical protein Mam01_45470 [Microbispora amethystogenes]
MLVLGVLALGVEEGVDLRVVPAVGVQKRRSEDSLDGETGLVRHPAGGGTDRRIRNVRYVLTWGGCS